MRLGKDWERDRANLCSTYVSLFLFSRTFYFPLVVNFKNTTQQKKTNKKDLKTEHQEKGNKFYN